MPVDRLIHPRLGHSAKVSSLTHLEARVWFQYMLSADDFGVMRYEALQIQADNKALAAEPLEVITAALDKLVAVQLLRTFDHQKASYLFQVDWQDFQKIEYPRQTILPKPDDESISICTVKTRKLFRRHPGGSSKSSRNVFRKFSEHSPTTRARVRAKRLTANGKRQTANGRRPTANGSEGERERERPFRPTPEEIKRARSWRQHVGYCPHDPRCPSSERCLGVQIRLWRNELEAGTAGGEPH